MPHMFKKREDTSHYGCSSVREEKARDVGGSRFVVNRIRPYRPLDFW